MMTGVLLVLLATVFDRKEEHNFVERNMKTRCITSVYEDAIYRVSTFFGFYLFTAPRTRMTVLSTPDAIASGMFPFIACCSSPSREAPIITTS